MDNNESNDVKTTLPIDSTSGDNKPETHSKPKEKEEVDIGVEALIHLNYGKRHLLIKDYSSAVLSLQESCQLFDQRFGIGAEECGEAYLYYGTALLELARLEDGIFDGVVHTKLADMSEDEETADEADDEEEGEDDSQDETENKDPKPEDKKTDSEEDIEDSDEEKRKLKESKSEVLAENTVGAQSSANTDDKTPEPLCLASTSKAVPNEDNEDTEDDASNIEVSWEVLSLAKQVFKRYIDKNDNKLKLAETLQKLGEISIEWENNQNAIEILNECLSVRKEVLAEDDRLIAETYYHLGIAYSFNKAIDSAKNCYNSALQVMETRIANQKQKLATISAEDTDSIDAINRDVSDLENLLPELRNKIEDSKDQMFNVKEALEREENERIKEKEMALKNKEIRDKPITDISHLIKRKRQNSGPETTPKKICSTNGHNVEDSVETSGTESAAQLQS